MSKNVFVIAEQRDGELQKVSVELIGKANDLAKDLGQEVVAVVLGEKVEKLAETMIHHGANKVIVVEDPMLKEYVTEPYAKAVFEIIKKYDPEIVLYGASSIGRDLAPRLAARIHTGLTADCTGLDIDPETKNLMMTRPAFGGNLMATIVCENHRPQMATVRPGVMTPLENNTSLTGEVIVEDIKFTEEDMNVKVIEVSKSEKKKMDITEANVLVSGGRGLGGPEGFEKLQELADLMEGEVSSSRANVDAGWIEKDRQVGQTGKTVRPGVYFAMGISGAIQHLAGMEESDLIIAVNKNESAPIFDVADLGIVGDLNKVLPKLIEEYKKVKAQKEAID
ncbi:electron transfer flavoprotein subunit alpha/FixB family protein [Peptoniphilus sp. KCTC 25270]|uniref:electron transfer flavoprotein subunit alpha/FixB family protein n=1 Tax=Peptoniphilus sp. KCTC 25270 TaxID=2897414 RepID=UPI001E471684|nr:electron transfer flavoprotein subunit alpha/FixB family protein [Peptoniphilus sp. KCTC 25270]MCD1146776.1 electron transfer flavoprotein subunit alpha/FixB family protein [Peptoniphilus sp. KCTC 25270]